MQTQKLQKLIKIVIAIAALFYSIYLVPNAVSDYTRIYNSNANTSIIQQQPNEPLINLQISAISTIIMYIIGVIAAIDLTKGMSNIIQDYVNSNSLKKALLALLLIGTAIIMLNLTLFTYKNTIAIIKMYNAAI